MAKIKTKADKVKSPKVKSIVQNKVIKAKTRRLTKKTTRPSKLRRFHKTPERGVVYLSHVPHGFYEEEIQKYFDQFGKITNVSVPRSKTGKAKGYAFVEFKHPEVGKIAAETMNNYLMFNRVIKAKYLEPQEQKPKSFLQVKQNLMKQNTLMDRAQQKVEETRERKNKVLKTLEEAKVLAKLLRKHRAQLKLAKTLGLGSEVEINKGNADALLKRSKEVIEERKKAKEEEEKIRQEREAENKTAKEAAEKERIRIKQEKKVQRKKRLRALKLLKSQNPNYKEELEAKTKKLQKATEKKEKRILKKNTAETQPSEDENKDTDGLSSKPLANSSNVKSKLPVGGNLKKNKQKKLRLKKQLRSQLQREEILEKKQQPVSVLPLQTSKDETVNLQKSKNGKHQELVRNTQKQNSKVNPRKQKQIIVLSPLSTEKQSKKNKEGKLQTKVEQVKKVATKKNETPEEPKGDLSNQKSAEKSTAVILKPRKNRHRNRSSVNPAVASVKLSKKLRPVSKVCEDGIEASRKSPRKPRHRSRRSKE